MRPLGEKEDSIVWVRKRSTPLIAQVSFERGPNYKDNDKETKGKNNKKRKRSSGKVSTVVNVKGEEFDN